MYRVRFRLCNEGWSCVAWDCVKRKIQTDSMKRYEEGATMENT